MARSCYREIWVLPHDCSCHGSNGYYLAERFPADKELHLKGQVYKDNLSFWLLSGRMEVLNNTQVENAVRHCEERGEIINLVRANELPEGSRWLNLR